jgi:hypothetical protein
MNAPRADGTAALSAFGLVRGPAAGATTSSNGAGKAANIAERALVEIERAFVFVSKTEIKQLPGATQIIVQWENAGTTRAVGFTTHSSFEVFRNNIPKDFPFYDRWTKDEIQSQIVMGPKGHTSEIIVINDNVLALARAGTHKIFIWGWAEYRDIFSEKQHRTEF